MEIHSEFQNCICTHNTTLTKLWLYDSRVANILSSVPCSLYPLSICGQAIQISYKNTNHVHQITYLKAINRTKLNFLG